PPMVIACRRVVGSKAKLRLECRQDDEGIKAVSDLLPERILQLNRWAGFVVEHFTHFSVKALAVQYLDDEQSGKHNSQAIFREDLRGRDKRAAQKNIIAGPEEPAGGAEC